MRVLEGITQGSPEWLAARTQYFTASEAPAMMGASKYQTRSELLHQKATGLTPDVDRNKQALFDRGHAAEAAARTILEEKTGEEFYPITAVSDDGKLLASVDGITMGDDVLFEHKLWSESLAAQVRAGELEPHYTWQLEQQLLVTGAEKVIFVCSDGTRENWVQMEYHPIHGRAAQLVAAWNQFEQDLAAYVPPEAAAPAIVAEPVQALPAVTVQVTGEITIKDNFATFETALRDFLEHRLIREPKTDQDFADLDVQIKAMKGAEAALDSAEAGWIAQIEAVSTAKGRKDMLQKLVKDNRLMAEKLLASEKERRKAEIVTKPATELRAYMTTLNRELGAPYIPMPVADFAGAIKGMRSLSSMEDAVATLLAKAKIDANAIAATVRANLKTLDELGADHSFLFADKAQIVLKASDDFQTLVKSRISDHKAAEAAKEVKRQADADRAAAEKLMSAAYEAAKTRVGDDRAYEVYLQFAGGHGNKVPMEKVNDYISALGTLQPEQNTTERGTQQVLKAEAATPDATDRVTPAIASPGVGPMGAGQPADAGPAGNVVPMRPAAAPVAAPATPPTLKLGQIGERLGFGLTAEFLKSLGFEPAARDKNALLFHESTFPLICAAIVRHVEAVQAKQAA